MAISKSTPYVRYKKDFTSSLHLGTIHIESEYLDRTQKTTIESIHGMTWHNKVVNENKELNLLSDTQLELTDLEKQYWNTGEKRVSVDEIHTLEEVEPNEDGTYTYMVNSMEGEYIEIYDGINNITSTSDGLDGQFEIVYDTTEEDVSGNIALDQVAPQYEITDSGVGTVTSAKSTGLTLVNHITEPSKEEVVAIEEYEGQYFTIENTVQGNIKSAILKGQTLVNYFNPNTMSELTDEGFLLNEPDFSKQRVFNYIPLQPYEDNTEYTIIVWLKDVVNPNNVPLCCAFGNNDIFINKFKNGINIVKGTTKTTFGTPNIRIGNLDVQNGAGATLMGAVILKGDYTTISLNSPFYGMQSVKMPVLKTTEKNLFDEKATGLYDETTGKMVITNSQPVGITKIQTIRLEKGTYTLSLNNASVDSTRPVEFGFYDFPSSKWAFGLGVNFHDLPCKTFTVTESNQYDFVVFAHGSGAINRIEVNIQLEKNSINTLYEPHKSNILTVNEDVELRGIGDVKDTLDCLTGELTQRIASDVFNGSSYENITIFNNTFTNVIWFKLLLSNNTTQANSVMCDRFKTDSTWGDYEETQNHANSNNLFVGIKRDRLDTEDVNGFKTWLSQNPITVQYELVTPAIKTVDLSIIDQDGNTIPHIQTQPTTTHVSTSSDGLTPVVEMSCQYDTIIKPNTTYTIKLDRPIVSDTMYLQVDLGGTMMMLDADVNAFTIKTPSTLSHSQLRLSGTGNTVKEIIVLEGNRVNDKIEYFEGMKNVENPILIVSNCPYVFGKGGRI